MAKRFVSIWFRHLLTDGFSIRRPELRKQPFVISTQINNRMVIAFANPVAIAAGVYTGMSLADARAIVPGLATANEQPGLDKRLLQKIAAWCIRFTPVTALDLPNGLLLDVSGCAHLWGGEQAYLQEILQQIRNKGYDVRGAMADTVGAAWAFARFGKENVIERVCFSSAMDELLLLPAAALRIEALILDRLQKLGLHTIGSFIHLQRSALKRRFGQPLLDRIDQLVGLQEENLQAVDPPRSYEERLPCPEPIVTRTGIDIALQRLTEALCKRLLQEGKGMRAVVFKGYRVDGKIQQVNIGTNHPSHNTEHVLKLFEIHLDKIAPALGIELFTLEATQVEVLLPFQEQLWMSQPGLQNRQVVELLDTIATKLGPHHIHRYLPQAHYWPERSFKEAGSLQEPATVEWQLNKARPLQLLAQPEKIRVTAPVPDYPPMLFVYKGKIHTIRKADGPERIEREWWLEEGEHRDYYQVENEEGKRYWLFRSGHYGGSDANEWFLHGFFA